MAPKGLRGLIKFLAVDLGMERVDAQLGTVERQVAFARAHKLVEADREAELVEMLIGGVKLPDAISELRSRRRERRV